jgi:hypothetical protein
MGSPIQNPKECRRPHRTAPHLFAFLGFALLFDAREFLQQLGLVVLVVVLVAVVLVVVILIVIARGLAGG